MSHLLGGWIILAKVKRSLAFCLHIRIRVLKKTRIIGTEWEFKWFNPEWFRIVIQKVWNKVSKIIDMNLLTWTEINWINASFTSKRTIIKILENSAREISNVRPEVWLGSVGPIIDLSLAPMSFVYSLKLIPRMSLSFFWLESATISCTWLTLTSLSSNKLRLAQIIVT